MTMSIPTIFHLKGVLYEPGSQVRDTFLIFRVLRVDLAREYFQFQDLLRHTLSLSLFNFTSNLIFKVIGRPIYMQGEISSC